MPRKTAVKTKDKKTRKRKMQKYARLRGMKDVLPEEYKYWELAQKKASDLAAAYGFLVSRLAAASRPTTAAFTRRRRR